MLINVDITPSIMTGMLFETLKVVLLDGMEHKLRCGIDSNEYLHKRNRALSYTLDEIIKNTLNYYEEHLGVYTVADLRHAVTNELFIYSDKVTSNYSRGFFYITFELLYIVAVKDTNNKLRRQLSNKKIKSIRIFKRQNKYDMEIMV